MPLQGDVVPSDYYERLIRLEADVRHLKKDFDLTARLMEKRDGKLQDLHETMIEAKGGLKILVAVAAAAGSLGALLAKLIPWESLTGKH